jgi:putative transposase
MPRANRFMQPGLIYHLTHRCHDGKFLFSFSRDKSEYQNSLRQESREIGVSLLNYCLTSNHIHIIAVESEHKGISRMMQILEGKFAESFNKRKDRSGSFWNGRYHCTMIEDGEHLYNCIAYVDMNMVRAGVVNHPRDWPWCGYSELEGRKNRYRLLDQDCILESLGSPDLESFRRDYQSKIQNLIDANILNREKYWTESIAVGSKPYLEKIIKSIKYERRKFKIDNTFYGSWYVYESPASYLAG